MRKIFYLPALLFLILTACKKDESAYLDIDKASAQMSRSFYYHEEDLTIAQTYVQHINHLCKFDVDENLILNFSIPYENGRDEVTFMIEKDKIRTDFTGTYEIKPSKSSDVAAFYLYRLTTSSSNRFLPEHATGVLTITKYDSKSKTLTGDYRLTINSFNDPASSTVPNFKETTTSVSGSFANIQLKTTE
jgi:hypothetical protein